MDPNATQLTDFDPHKTQMTGAALNVTQTISPVQCPVCKTHNPAGEGFCIECGLIFQSALPDDAFGAPAVRPPCLIEENGREHYLRPGKNLIGREGDIAISDSRVSRKHAEVEFANGNITISDLGSTNGTVVEGSALEPNMPVGLAQGAKIEIGGVALTLSMPGDANKTSAIPSPNKTQIIAGDDEEQEPASISEFILVIDGNENALKLGENAVGRRPSNDIVLDDPYASGAHGKVEVESDGVYFTDLGSTNGTFLNGAKMPANERVKLSSEDEITIGQLAVRIKSK